MAEALGALRTFDSGEPEDSKRNVDAARVDENVLLRNELMSIADSEGSFFPHVNSKETEIPMVSFEKSVENTDQVFEVLEILEIEEGEEVDIEERKLEEDKDHEEEEEKEKESVEIKEGQSTCQGEDLASISVGEILEIEEVDIEERKVEEDKVHEEEEEKEEESVEIKEGQSTFEGEDSASISVAEILEIEEEEEVDIKEQKVEEDKGHEEEEEKEKEISAGSKIGCGIVDMDHFVDNLFKIAYDDEKRHKKTCQRKQFREIRSTRRGFETIIFLYCNDCKTTISQRSHPNNPNVMKVNEAMVLGSMTSGSGYSNLKELLAPAGIPCVSAKTYRKIQEALIKQTQSISMERMRAAVEKEKKIALEKGHFVEVLKDSVLIKVIFLTIITDGSWLKRTYPGGAYDSLGGCVVIIGYHTKEPLDLIVKCKACATCDRAMRENREPTEHVCFKNFDRNKSSGAMEAEATAEAFNTSYEKYKVIYRYLIGDGDSSVYSSILNHDPYREFGITVKKLECKNHKLRNHCNHLEKIGTTKNAHEVKGDAEFRKMVSSNKLRIREEILFRAKQRREDKSMTLEKKIRMLFEDIVNVPSHVFGEHEKCAQLSWECGGKREEGEENHVPRLRKMGVYQKVHVLHKQLAEHAESLLYDVTNNDAECYNSVVAKHVAGKRINFAMKGSYVGRCHLAALAHSTKHAQTTFIEASNKIVPDTVRSMEDARELQVSRNKQYGSSKRRKIQHNKKSDQFYGEKSQKPDLEPHVYMQKKEHVMQDLKKYQQSRIEIANETIGQSGTEQWNFLRRMMCTSSNFGEICNRRDTTSCVSIVKKYIYARPSRGSEAMLYGKMHEEDARKELQEYVGYTIKPAGLHIDPDLPYVASSPDGLVDAPLSDLIFPEAIAVSRRKMPEFKYNVIDSGVVEIKCPKRAEHMTIEEAIEKYADLKNVYNKNKDKKGKKKQYKNVKKPMSMMNVNHKHYFQVQGQLHTTRRLYCIFVMWTPNQSFKVTVVLRDDKFWNDHMEPKITRFFMECMLPELVDSRYNRNLQIREAEFIINSRQSAESAKPKEGKTSKEKIIKNVITSESEEDYLHQEIEFAKKGSNESEGEDDEDIDFLGIEAMSNANQLDDPTEAEWKGFRNINAKVHVDKIAPIILCGHMLDDSCLDAFIEVMKSHSSFDIQSTLAISYPRYQYPLPPDQVQDIQILGGNCTGHWRCFQYYNGQVLIFDSLYMPTYESLAAEEQNFLQKRYKKISNFNVIPKAVTKQPDGTSCGVYAVAFATSLILGKDPCCVRYSTNAAKMRIHFMQIINTKTLTHFPEE